MDLNFGFNIDEKTFMSLSQKNQNLVLYRTLTKNKRLYNYINFIWLSALTLWSGLYRFLKF